jgi:hypothetical protein
MEYSGQASGMVDFHAFVSPSLSALKQIPLAPQMEKIESKIVKSIMLFYKLGTF